MSGLMSRLATESVGARAEKHIHDRLREALPPEFTLLPERRLGRPRPRRRARGRGRRHRRPPRARLPGHRGQVGPDHARRAGSLVGGRPPPRSRAVRAGGRQPPLAGGQAARAARLAGRAQADVRPRRRLPERGGREPRHQGLLPRARRRPRPDHRSRDARARRPAQRAAADVGRHGVRAVVGRQGAVARASRASTCWRR